MKLSQPDQSFHNLQNLSCSYALKLNRYELCFINFLLLSMIFGSLPLNAQPSGGPLFKSSDLGDYHLLKAFPGTTTATRLLDEIRKFLGQSRKDTRFIGAYPPLP